MGRVDAVGRRRADDHLRGGVAGVPAHPLLGGGRHHRVVRGAPLDLPRTPRRRGHRRGGPAAAGPAHLRPARGGVDGVRGAGLRRARPALAALLPGRRPVAARRGEPAGAAHLPAAAADRRAGPGRSRPDDAHDAPEPAARAGTGRLARRCRRSAAVLSRRCGKLPRRPLRGRTTAGDASAGSAGPPRRPGRAGRAALPASQSGAGRCPAGRRQRDRSRHADRPVPGDQRRALRRLTAHARSVHRRARRRRPARLRTVRPGEPGRATGSGDAGRRGGLGARARRVRHRRRTGAHADVPRHRGRRGREQRGAALDHRPARDPGRAARPDERDRVCRRRLDAAGRQRPGRSRRVPHDARHQRAVRRPGGRRRRRGGGARLPGARSAPAGQVGTNRADSCSSLA